MLDIRILAAGAMAIMIATYHPTTAGSTALHATADGSGNIAIAAAHVTPEACWAVAAAGPGAPVGTRVPQATIAATVTLKKLSPDCPEALNTVPVRFSIPDVTGARAVMVSYLDDSRQILRTETTHIVR